MNGSHLPGYGIKIKKIGNKKYIYDPLRRSFVKLTPEELVRQHFVRYLIDEKGYPPSLMANEVEIKLGNVRKRCDSVIYDRFMEPLAIIEYKAPGINISQKTFDQISRYNMRLKVKWLIVSNGLRHYCCKINYTDNSCIFLMEIPAYTELQA